MCYCPMRTLTKTNLQNTLEMSGSRAVWKEVLAVYSVKVNTDPDEPMEVATVDDISNFSLVPTNDV